MPAQVDVAAAVRRRRKKYEAQPQINKGAWGTAPPNPFVLTFLMLKFIIIVDAL